MKHPKRRWTAIEGPGSIAGLESPDGGTRIFEDGSIELIDHCEWPSRQLATAKIAHAKKLTGPLRAWWSGAATAASIRTHIDSEGPHHVPFASAKKIEAYLDARRRKKN